MLFIYVLSNNSFGFRGKFATAVTLVSKIKPKKRSWIFNRKKKLKKIEIWKLRKYIHHIYLKEKMVLWPLRSADKNTTNSYLILLNIEQLSLDVMLGL